MEQTRLKTATNGHERPAGPIARAATDPAIAAAIAATAAHEGITVLPLAVAIYVPSTEDGRPIAQSEFAKRTDQTARQLSAMFGGCTVIPAGGYWVDPDGRLIHERINIARAATDPATLAAQYDPLVDLIGQYGRYWKQVTMAADIGGQLLLIDS